jgi:hypothetical protein
LFFLVSLFFSCSSWGLCSTPAAPCHSLFWLTFAGGILPGLGDALEEWRGAEV